MRDKGAVAVISMSRLSHAFGRLLDGLALLAAVILLVMVALVTADIVLRNLTNGGFTWANEVSEYALYVMTLLTAPWLLRRGQHVRVDLLLGVVPSRMAWTMEALADLIGLAVCAVLVRYGWAMAVESHRLDALTIKNLVFPEWWLLAPLPVAFGLLAIEFGFRFARLWQGPRTRRVEATSVG
jgi:TRAP-type C4-dicarboxylate transport system permease small subunit